jgi:hypothetical protein
MFSNNVDDSGSVLSRLKEQWDHPAVRNADNIGLGAAGPAGHVDEVNGDGAAEMPGFVPTRHELIELAKYWTGVTLDIQYEWFIDQQVGSSDRRIESFARRRVSRIARLLGDEAVTKAITAVEEQLGKKFGNPKYWDIFLRDTPEEHKVAQDEIAREMYGDDPKSKPSPAEVSGAGANAANACSPSVGDTITEGGQKEDGEAK